MKTARQIQERLEVLASEFRREAESCPEGKISDEVKLRLGGLFMAIFALGWVIGAEKDLEEITAKIDAANTLAGLAGVLKGSNGATPGGHA